MINPNVTPTPFVCPHSSSGGFESHISLNESVANRTPNYKGVSKKEKKPFRERLKQWKKDFYWWWITN